MTVVTQWCLAQRKKEKQFAWLCGRTVGHGNVMRFWQSAEEEDEQIK